MKILVVEDDRQIASAVREGLDDSGYTTQVSRDGERALALATNNSFSVIILDIMLPGMDGITFCKKLREAKVNTPILMMTAKATVPDRIVGLDAGADDYLVKPFDFDELLARVRALLRRDKVLKQSSIQVGDLVLDTLARTVSRGGKEIRLSGREYTLLEALATQEGRILSRNNILENVWMDEQSLSNVVDVYIRNLRKKIDEAHEHKLIQTVHGLGYVMRGPVQGGTA
jgi:DNA-binding response OmpR family regulator